MTRCDLSDLLEPGRPVRDTASGIPSVLSSEREQARYDGHAAVYDRVIASRLYNRLVWGTRTRDYATFLAEALASGHGPLLDVGCGTAVFTSAVYRAASRRLVLIDRSLAMLQRAPRRLDGAPVALMHADMFDLPFAPRRFETVCCFAVLHVLEDPWEALAALERQVAPGGRLFCSMLVADRGGITVPYMAALRRRGEIGPPRTTSELQAVAAELFGSGAKVGRTGSMAWLRAQR